jgi:arylamine N-acetyltransferase
MEWKKNKAGQEYRVVFNKEGKKVLQIRYKFDPKQQTPKDFVKAFSSTNDNDPSNIYHHFKKAYVSKNKLKWSKIKPLLSKNFPAKEDREAYFNYLNLHKDEIDKYSGELIDKGENGTKNN